MTGMWLDATLGDIAEIVSGATPKTAIEEYWDGGIPWATPKDLSELKGTFIGSTPRTLSSAGLKSCAAKLLPAESVLLSSRAPIGLVAINSVPMATNQGFKSLVPDRAYVDPKFLYWWLRCHRPQLEAMGNGATFKEISKRIVAGAKIRLPPIEQQQRIASVLDTADALRAKRREALAKLDDLIQSVFVSMFGSAIAAVPSTAVTLGEIAEVVSGATPKTSVTHYWGGGIAWATPRDLGGLEGPYIDATATPRTLSQEGLKNCSAKLLPVDSVLLSSRAPIGYVAMNRVPMATNQGFKSLVPDPAWVDPRFLYAWLRRQRTRLESLGSGATFKEISKKIVEAIEIHLPPLSEQRRFGEVLDAIEKMRVRHAESRDMLETLFASLRQRTFREEP